LFQKAQNNIHFMVNASYTTKQQLVDQQLDYVPPPDAYFLLHSEWVADWLIAKQIMHFNIGVNNILNTRYRDYLNRNRYFANENGRNFYFRCSIPLFISSNKKLETNKN
jgi:iron complex outermembrane receptor protein